MTVTESRAYADALRTRMLGGSLDDEQHEVLELGRREAGYPDGRYPLPISFCDTVDDVRVGAAVAPDRPRPPAPPTRRLRDQYGESIADVVADTGLCPARSVHAFRP